ncbi:hypothetical protein L1987_07782 [Smallanthus sonchifolius]|uniref:Uncharacterized protein n=1 Tax=Smallanthus sonchifolius TaxID=185202 RepID=A0ACB9JIA2_9ASTR|nr:hypothetical protein L1987_07782 [Smallanthus sonchifolius]
MKAHIWWCRRWCRGPMAGLTRDGSEGRLDGLKLRLRHRRDEFRRYNHGDGGCSAASQVAAVCVMVFNGGTSGDDSCCV